MQGLNEAAQLADSRYAVRIARIRALRDAIQHRVISPVERVTVSDRSNGSLMIMREELPISTGKGTAG